MQAAAIMAAFVYQTAMRDEMLPQAPAEADTSSAYRHSGKKDDGRSGDLRSRVDRVLPGQSENRVLVRSLCLGSMLCYRLFPNISELFTNRCRLIGNHAVRQPQRPPYRRQRKCRSMF